MQNLIPHFIQSQFVEGHSSGEMEGIGLFMDISGFTKMTETLMQSGKEGAEVLSEILNELFEPLINSVYEREGYITGFAGDAFTALFPAQAGMEALFAARNIQEIFHDHGHIKTRVGEFHLSVKIGLERGAVEWGIVGAGPLKNYYFRGAAIDGCAQAEHHCTQGRIVIGAELLNSIEKSEVQTETINKQFCFLNTIIQDEPLLSPADQEKERIKPETLKAFYPETHALGEFRRMVSVFISFEAPPGYSELNQLASIVLEEAALYQGYFNSLDFGDKGGVMLVLFGAPRQHENDEKRAGDFALSLKEKLGDKIRIGLTRGVAYAGMAGSSRRSSYTALGAVVNLSARLMMSAEPGEIRTTEDLEEYLKRFYKFEYIDTVHFKGIKQATQVFQLSGTNQNQEAGNLVFEYDLVGRHTELEALKKLSAPLFLNRFAGLVSLVGAAGVGKSHLLHEFSSLLGDKAQILKLQADGILRKSLNPFTAFLRDMFLKGAAPDALPREVFQSRLSEFLKELREAAPEEKELLHELERTASLLGAMLNIRFEYSLYERLDAKGRFDNTLFALKELFKAMSRIRPLLLILEDFQFLDADSKQAILNLSRNIQGYPILIVAAGRPADDGTHPVLEMSPETDRSELELLDLNNSERQILIKQLLGRPADKELREFIISRTEGNPFYIDQFCRYLQENQFLILNRETYTLKEKNLELPSGINSILISRIDRLDTALREAVQSAAVLGREFPIALLLKMLDGVDLAGLLKSGVNELIWAPVDQDIYTFNQGLLRDAAYDMQLTDRLRNRHFQAARLLENYRPDDETAYADLSYHYENADIQDKAQDFTRRAAVFAQDNYKNDRALHFYEKLLNYETTPQERLKIVGSCGDILQVMGRWEETQILLQDNIKQATEAGLDLEHSRLLTQLGEVLQKKGDYYESQATLQEAVELSQKIGSDENEGRSYLFLGRTCWSRGNYDQALEYLEKSLVKRKELEDQEGIALALYYIGVVHRDKGDYAGARECYEESRKILADWKNKLLLTYPLYDLGVLLLYEGRLVDSLDYFVQAMEIYEEIGYSSGSAAALLNLGVIEARLGNFTKALEYYTDSHDIALEIGEPLAIAYALFSVGTVRYKTTAYDEALKCFEKSFEIMKSIGAKGYYGYVFAYLTCLYSRNGFYSRALRMAAYHIKYIRKSGSDVENGRTYLGVALALKHQDRFGKKAQHRLKRLTRFNGMPNTPQAYFKEAIQKARDANYASTLIPALREFGVFLYGRHSDSDDTKDALELFAEARERAAEAGMEHELHTIKAYFEKFGIEN